MLNKSRSTMLALLFIEQSIRFTVTYDHRLERIGHPVRSAIHKLQIGRLVVGWVTTSEYLLLYVFVFFCFILFIFVALHSCSYASSSIK